MIAQIIIGGIFSLILADIYRQYREGKLSQNLKNTGDKVSNQF